MVKNMRKLESHSEGIKIRRMDAAAGHKSAQKENSRKGGATGEILNFIIANGGLW